MSIKPRRHLAKAFTWRIIASLTTFLIGWSVTGDMHFGAAIGGFDVIIKIILYYFHERIWYLSKYGVVTDTNEKKGSHKNLNNIVKNKETAKKNNSVVEKIPNN